MIILQEAAEKYQSFMVDKEYPPCFDSWGDYEFWSDVEDLVHTQPIRKFVCRDCSSCFQKRMVEEKRCILPKISVSEILRD